MATGVLKGIPQAVVDLLVSKVSFVVLGLASGLSLFIEEKRRRAELAMYVLPKGLESLWIMLRGHGLVFKTGKWGETLVSPLLLEPKFPLIDFESADCDRYGHGDGKWPSVSQVTFCRLLMERVRQHTKMTHSTFQDLLEGSYTSLLDRIKQSTIGCVILYICC